MWALTLTLTLTLTLVLLTMYRHSPKYMMHSTRLTLTAAAALAKLNAGPGLTVAS
jgi:hypothetical protein